MPQKSVLSFAMGKAGRLHCWMDFHGDEISSAAELIARAALPTHLLPILVETQRKEG